MEPTGNHCPSSGLGLWILATAALALCACNGSSDGGGGSGSGAVSVAITDAPSDQVETFAVDVVELRLHRLGGGTVDLLDERVRVDLASLREEAHLLVLRDVPAGTYLGIDAVLDFADAQIALTGESAEASVLGMDGLQVDGDVTLPVTFGEPLAIRADEEHRLELDFDLTQSVAVIPGANTIALEPAAVVRVDPASPKDLVVAGELVRVEPANDGFRLRVLAPAGANLFGVDCEVDGGTVFQIDGVVQSGPAGLAALDGLAEGTPIEARGRLAAGAQVLRADLVVAGTGTLHGGTDVVIGNVVGRVGGAGSDAVLTVLGRSVSFDHATFQFDELFTVSTGFVTTKVVRLGSAGVFDVDDVNIGQRVRVYGALTNTSLDATGASSVLAMVPTLVVGSAAGPVSAGQLILDADRVDLRDVTAFDWSQSGSVPPDPDALVVQIDGQAEPITTDAGELVAVRGYFRPVDDAGDDFLATKAQDQDSADDFLWVRNRPFTGFDVVLTASPAEIGILIDNSAALGEFALVFDGLNEPAALPDLPAPAIQPESNAGIWVIRDRSAFDIDVFHAFDEFSAELADRFTGGNVTLQLSATGSWNATTHAFTAERAYVVVD